jgi:acetamidase/formamidase
MFHAARGKVRMNGAIFSQCNTSLRRAAGFLLASGLLYAQSGDWLFTLTEFGQPNYERAELKFDGDKITGRTGPLTLEGTVHNGRIEMEAKFSDGSLVGKVSGTIANGEIRGQGMRGPNPFDFLGRRIKDRPATPQTHRFDPTVFHNSFSSSAAPVLILLPGDTVESWSVDSGGLDAQERRRSRGGNPLTGPFYIEGAVPGDTLSIRFSRIRLTRDSAGSGQRVSPSALEPGYLARQQDVRNFDSSWTLDRSGGFARLSKPTDKLKDYRVPVKPMLGCVGVAPPRQQSFHSGYLGTFGGNMDYNGLVEGATVYLPVYQPGALLYVGDGHAAQGDGELTGDALETSTDWTFTVDVIRRSITQPRMETAEYWIASGIANSLQEALQAATTNLSRWLEEEYKLNPAEIGVVLGTSIRYEVAEVVDPRVHIVAKIAKGQLAPIPK